MSREVARREGEVAHLWRKLTSRRLLAVIGPSGVGKSSLAPEVARRLGVPGVVSTDSIRQVMRIMLSSDLVPAIHASSYDAHRVVTQTELPQDPVLDAFRAQASTVAASSPKGP